LKWNERERQKSFVVVEEGPQKHTKKKKKRNETLAEAKAHATEGMLEEEDGPYSDEEEEDTFDIDDSSPEAQSNGSKAGEEKISAPHPPLSPIVKRRTKSRSRSRPPGLRSSGVDSPGRFMSPAPHPPNVSPRHVGFHLPSRESSASSSPDSLLSYAAQQGTRDDLHLPRHSSGRSQIPKDRDLDLETVKTPTPGSLVHGRARGHSRSRSSDQHEPRAFAVWGHDESDSNTSDSES
jgi:NAD+ kinase